MPIQIHLDEERGLTVALASGAFTDREFIEVLDEIVKETSGAVLFKPVLFLFDERTSLHDLSLKGLLNIKSSIEGWGRVYPGRSVRTAFVASHNMHAAFARMWQAITIAHPKIGATVELFDAEEAAVAWLKS